MNEKVMQALDEVAVTIELPLREVNILLNILNAPLSSLSMTNAALIQVIQEQAGPQVEKARVALEAAIGDKDEPKTTAE